MMTWPMPRDRGRMSDPSSLSASVDEQLKRFKLWRQILASSAPEVFGALGAFAAIGVGLTFLLAPTIHHLRPSGVALRVPVEAWGMAFLVIGLWLLLMSFTGRRDDMESPALALTAVWAFFSVLFVIPDEHTATPAVVVLLFFATVEAALVSLMSGGSDD